MPERSRWENDCSSAVTYNEEVSTHFAVRKLAEADFPTRWGQFRIMGFEGQFAIDAESHNNNNKVEAQENVITLRSMDLNHY